jgi:hypothetical protein
MSIEAFNTYVPTPKPTVWVDPKVEESIGTPVIDYDGLAELHYGEMEIPTHIQTALKLKRLPSKTFGQHYLLTNTISLDPVKTLSPDSELTIPEVLIHESQHLADSKKHPIMATGLTALDLMVTTLGGYGMFTILKKGVESGLDNAEDAKINAALGALSLFASSKIIGKIYYDHLDYLETRAFRAESRRDLNKKYKNVIVFPKAITNNRIRRSYSHLGLI